MRSSLAAGSDCIGHGKAH